MTVALDATYSVGQNLSGVGVYSREILLGLAREHPDSEFYCCYRPHRILRSLKFSLPSNCHRRLLRETGTPPGDIFHGLNQRLPQAKLGRAVCTFHDLFVLTGDYSTAEFRRRFAEQARRAASASNAVIAVSQFTAQQVHTLLGVDWSRLHIVHHGVRRPFPQTCARENIVLHVGAIQRRKNLGRLVKAFEALPPDWSLVLAGPHGFGAKEILEQIETSPRRSQIRVLGYVPDKFLGRWYSRARIFAFPSLDEGFGMPILEAMAAGVPVLTSNRSALPEIAGQAALLCDPEDTSEIADGLLRLARDEGLRQSLIEDGLRRAATFTWEEATRATWQVYENLAR